MPLSWSDIRDRAVRFVKEHAGDQSEHAQSQLFWRDFLDVFGVPAARVGAYEHHVKVVRKDKIKNGRIDLFWPGKMLVEMKSAGKDLGRAFNQALEYFDNLPTRDLPRYILVSDFKEFRLYDMELGAQWAFSLRQLPDKIKLFAFIPGYEAPSDKPEIEANIKAAHRMGRLFEALEDAGYGKLREGHDLRVLMVRLLFCLFADDTGIFQPAGSFKELLDNTPTPSEVGRRLIELFEVLNTRDEDRQAGWKDDYAPFRYINGRLFEEPIRVPVFDAAARDLLLEAAAINWSHISPAIFGSLFQSIKERGERRRLGEHYTSEENILKLIKPLFLDDLWAEFERVKRQRTRLAEFHKKLRSLTFLDPACGCGNFLVIAYRELRRLELQVLRASNESGQQTLDVHILSQINVDQFHGIEIEEFPAQIAQVALWLTDHQMNRALTEEFGKYFERLPLVTQPHIVRANALREDWATVLPPQRCSYVLGNPPFVGAKFMDDSQREDTRAVFHGIENAGLLDLVAAWYVKSVRYLKLAGDRPDPPRAALVSTNSITQGEQVGVLWAWMLAQGVHIHFAHRTFKWGNEASGKAAVHCVIIGFGLFDVPTKTIFDYPDIKGEPETWPASNINPYLVDAPDIVLIRRSLPICAVPEIGIGNKPIDNGNYLFTTEQRDAFVRQEPASEGLFRRWLGAEEFLNGYERWCLWLGDCSPAQLRSMPEVLKRVQAVRAYRLASKSLPTQKLADTPTRFHVEFMPASSYLVIPEVSSERREYIPLGYLPPTTLASNKLRLLPNGSWFAFGVLHSAMHMAWTRYVCGRLESRYQYSIHVVYNNYPWPDLDAAPSERAAKVRGAIELAAQGVLGARSQFQTGIKPASLADLYDPDAMPPELRRAHQKLDAVVDAAYALCGGKKAWKNDAERVAFLFTLYQRYTSLLPAAAPTKTRRRAGTAKP